MSPKHAAQLVRAIPPLGLAVFDSLRAEDEPWLVEHAYVPPLDFELMAGARSIIAYGQPGSGKTGLRCALEHRALISTPPRLVVHWRPTLSSHEPAAGTPAGRAQSAQVMDACAMALLEHLARSPTLYGQCPEWAQRTCAWFIQRHATHLEERSAPLLSKVDSSGQALAHALIAQPTRPILAEDASIDLVVARLIEALSTIGISGVWVMAEGVEGLAESEPERLADALLAFLSNLAYLEQSPFFYKLVLPLSLQPRLDAAGGIARRRIFAHQLQWTPELLTRMVERRIALATGDDDFKITDLYSAPRKKAKAQPSAQKTEQEPTNRPELSLVQAWLAGCGGLVPRGWLDSASPLAAAFLDRRARGESGALTYDQWIAARGRMPLSLSLDEKSGLVKVGWRTVDRLPPLEQSMLRYLVANQGKICSKEELYKQAYLAPSDQTPPGTPRTSARPAARSETGNQGSAAPRKRKRQSPGYAYNLDTVLWRLREAIEPDVDDPVFIVTYRGQGVVLNLQPFGQ